MNQSITKFKRLVIISNVFFILTNFELFALVSHFNQYTYTRRICFMFYMKKIVWLKKQVTRLPRGISNISSWSLNRNKRDVGN